MNSFNLTCDYFAFGCLGYTLIFLFFNVLIDIGKDQKEQDQLAKNLEIAVENALQGGDLTHIDELDDETTETTNLSKMR